MNDKRVISATLNPQDVTRQLYTNWRERFALPLLIGVLIFGALALFPAVNASDSYVLDSILIISYLLTLIVTIIRFSYTIRISVFLLSIFMIGVGELITHNILGDSLFFFLAFTVFSTMMLSPRAGIYSIGINIFTLVILGSLILNDNLKLLNPLATPAGVEDWLSAGFAIIMFGIVIILGFRSLEKEFFDAQTQIDSTLNTLEQERNNLENKVRERTQQLRKINEIDRNVSEILDTNLLFSHAAKLIENEFGLYYTAFYIINPTGKWADLKYASGEAGKVLSENKHRVDLDGRNIIAKALQSKTWQIASDLSQIRIENPLLPYTRSQLALPLLIGDTALGVLDLHSTKDDVFTAQDVDTYQNMANGIATAIENSRLFQEAQQSLAELRATQRQYLQNAWGSLSGGQALEYELGEQDNNSENNIHVPLVLRDQIIGQVEMADSGEWSPEQKNVVEAIVAQATLALENARLVEESQITATQERLSNEIISKIWASSNMDSIMQTVVREIGRSLEATEVEIEVSMDDKE